MSEFHHLQLVTRGAKVPPFKVKGQMAFVTALPIADPGKPVSQDPALEIPINHFLGVWTEKAVSLFKLIFINALEGLEIILQALVIGRILRSSRTVNGCGHRQGPSISNSVISAAISVPVPYLELTSRRDHNMMTAVFISTQAPT